jgi:hypothetical protein
MDSQAKEKVFWGAVKNGDGAKSRTEDTEGDGGHGVGKAGGIIGWRWMRYVWRTLRLSKARF